MSPDIGQSKCSGISFLAEQALWNASEGEDEAAELLPPEPNKYARPRDAMLVIVLCLKEVGGWVARVHGTHAE